MAVDLAKLKALGLTPRQAEITFWIAQGKTNEEMAIIVGASCRTVAHHVEAILARLHLSNRVQIMLLVLESLGWLKWPTSNGNLRKEAARNQRREEWAELPISKFPACSIIFQQ